MSKFIKISIALVSVLCYCTSLHSSNNLYSTEEIRFALHDLESANNDTVFVNKTIELVELLPITSSERFGYIEKGLELAKKNKLNEETGILYYELAWHYFSKNDEGNTILCFREAAKFTTDPELLTYIYGCLSDNYSWIEDYKTALQYAQLSYEISKQSGIEEIEHTALMFMGDMYRYQGNMNAAKDYYLKVWDSMYNRQPKVLSVFYVIINMYIGNNQTGAAPYTSFFFAMKLKEKYDNSSPRQKQIFVYNLIKAANSSIFNTGDLVNKTTILIRSVITILFLLAITTLLIIQIHVNRKANRRLKIANEVKSKLFLVLNHDMRQPIASLSSCIKFKKENPDIPEAELKELDDKTLEIVDQTLKGLEDLIVWSKNQMQSFSLDRRQVSISDVFCYIKDSFKYKNGVSLHFENPDNLSLKTDENCLKILLRNLTSNAISIAQDAERKDIIWKAYKSKRNTILSIRNFGPKMRQEHIDILLSQANAKISATGTGLIIIRDIAKTIKCKIEVETGNGGTTFRLVF